MTAMDIHDDPSAIEEEIMDCDTQPISTENTPEADNYIQEETLLDSNEGIQFAPGKIN